MTVPDLLRDALLEIGTIDPLDAVPAELQALALLRLNGIIDLWNAQQIATYNVNFTDFTLTTGLSPQTIGPSGATFTASQRPVAIIGANLLIGSGTNLVKLPITIRDDAWWLKQPTPNIQSGVPTDLYYSPSWTNGNGSLYFWPVPNVAYQVELEARFVLASLALTDTFSMPPGYQRALTLTLAEDVAGPLTVPMPPQLPGKARDARAVVFGNNNDPVRIKTRDSGMPGSLAGGGFNWRTGTGAGR